MSEAPDTPRKPRKPRRTVPGLERVSRQAEHDRRKRRIARLERKAAAAKPWLKKTNAGGYDTVAGIPLDPTSDKGLNKRWAPVSEYLMALWASGLNPTEMSRKVNLSSGEIRRILHTRRVREAKRRLMTGILEGLVPLMTRCANVGFRQLVRLAREAGDEKTQLAAAQVLAECGRHVIQSGMTPVTAVQGTAAAQSGVTIVLGDEARRAAVDEIRQQRFNGLIDADRSAGDGNTAPLEWEPPSDG